MQTRGISGSRGIWKLFRMIRGFEDKILPVLGWGRGGGGVYECEKREVGNCIVLPSKNVQEIIIPLFPFTHHQK